MTTDQDGGPHSPMRYQDSRWIYAEVAAGAVGGLYDERGNSMWPVFEVLSLVEDGTRMSVPDLEDLIRARDQRAEASVETPDETTPEPVPNPRQAQLKKTPVETPPIKAEPPSLPKWMKTILQSPVAALARCGKSSAGNGRRMPLVIASLSGRRSASSSNIAQTSTPIATWTNKNRCGRPMTRSAC